MDNIIVRQAQKNDVPAINNILNYAIVNTNYNLKEQPLTIDDSNEWFDKHIGAGYPILVAELDGTVVGWASLSQFREYTGYNCTAEVSVYVAQGYGHRGIGTKLLNELEKYGQKFHTLIAVVTDSNVASLSLHSRCGFVPMCTFKELGKKNGEYVDITFMTKILNK